MSSPHRLSSGSGPVTEDEAIAFMMASPLFINSPLAANWIVAYAARLAEFCGGAWANVRTLIDLEHTAHCHGYGYLGSTLAFLERQREEDERARRLADALKEFERACLDLRIEAHGHGGRDDERQDRPYPRITPSPRDHAKLVAGGVHPGARAPVDARPVSHHLRARSHLERG